MIIKARDITLHATDGAKRSSDTGGEHDDDVVMEWRVGEMDDKEKRERRESESVDGPKKDAGMRDACD